MTMRPIDSDPDFHLGIRLFNEGRFWDSHEAFERVWRPLPRELPERRLLQAIILLAAAFLHRDRARSSPARSLAPAMRCARSAAGKLEGIPEGLLGLDIALLRRSAAACFDGLASGRVPDDAPPPPHLVHEAPGA